MNILQAHRKETEDHIRKLSKTDDGKREIACWILQDGYYPEAYVVPPCFKMSDLQLKKERNIPEIKKLSESKQLVTLSFPKTGIMQRTFGIMHPHLYHDIVWELMNDWDNVLNILFNAENHIYSYSFPIALSVNGKGKLRAGRMIYEFLEMAEKDLVAEAYRYKFLTKVDITNFYNSVYTHTIAWAWCGDRYEALKDINYKNAGSRIDKLFQYSNDKRTSGIPVGPVLSDIIIEIILSERDTRISNKIKEFDIDYLATRFKDDYRILTHSEEDSNKIIRIIVDTLNEFNLQVNESKTKTVTLPDGLYRAHSIKYEPFSLKNKRKIPFKKFEQTLLKTLEIHREFQGTSILEKFLSELFDNNKNKKPQERLKIEFINKTNKEEEFKPIKTQRKNIKKAISLLLMLKEESSKSLGKVLSVIECLLLDKKNKWLIDDGYLLDVILVEIEKAILKDSAFELVWYLYFCCRHTIDIDLKRIAQKLKKKGDIKVDFSKIPIIHNYFVATLRNKFPNKKGDFTNPFGDTTITGIMFHPPKDLQETFLVDYLDVFNRVEPES